MSNPLAEEKPIFLQIAERLEDAILSGAFPEESRLPSTTEISAAYRINPATALKGVSILVDEGVAYKQRGIGMFVCKGARSLIEEKRRSVFYSDFVLPLVSEAKKLGISEQGLTAMLERGYRNETRN
jgi:GntR family transcriptional regulator